eukprot:CAMPEP_0183595768 /NCGR_PEP_ID=MMETSP0371-20130417/173962_1 /TAXON_ID=268820 /ORGANISM="Peridinium aciculiferum, Strain PAER-2" /LENGTH=96 /DNA_ID=CAMNT_0025807581 /DNA_START=20 /DNA_END=307 /DNA_ORIENTATION=-
MCGLLLCAVVADVYCSPTCGGRHKKSSKDDSEDAVGPQRSEESIGSSESIAVRDRSLADEPTEPHAELSSPVLNYGGVPFAGSPTSCVNCPLGDVL